jgi:hypothetical protein
MGRSARRETLAAPGELEQVLGTEQRLADLLAAAETEARQVVDAARSEARRLEQTAPARLDAAMAQLRDTEAVYQREATGRIAAQLAADAGRFQALDDAAIARLADLALRMLVEDLA